ncbi:MAG: HupE/UreJ family protein [Pseudomonadota bacterium]|nr:HupE/UreJ family protein [Pseudomonadota bacterium]
MTLNPRLLKTLITLLGLSALAFSGELALAHGVAEGDANFLQNQQGFQFWPYAYLGAKHMVTGYDHLLFLAGVIFFVYRLTDVALYVTLFAIGHSFTLILGVWLNIGANAYLVDALIGFSVVYKAFDNLGGCRQLGFDIPVRPMVLTFGLVHGFGLATKLQELSLDQDSLVGNLLAFNLGVEVGQFCALLAMVLGFTIWRRSRYFTAHAITANIVIMTAGFLLMGYQLSGYFLSP